MFGRKSVGFREHRLGARNYDQKRGGGTDGPGNTHSRLVGWLKPVQSPIIKMEHVKISDRRKEKAKSPTMVGERI